MTSHIVGLRQTNWSISIYSVKWGRLCDITCSGDWSISIYLNLDCVLLMGLNFQWPDKSNISSSDLQHHHNNNTLVHLSCTHLTAQRDWLRNFATKWIATVYGALCTVNVRSHPEGGNRHHTYGEV